jgi:hypothetical protein
MGAFSDTPNLIAGGTIAPYRFVAISTSADDTGVQASARTDAIVGIADSSTNAFNSSTVHAASGDPITLQPGANGTVLVEAGAAITVGDILEADANGKAITKTTSAGTAYQGYIALQAAGAAGAKIRVQRIAGWVKY